MTSMLRALSSQEAISEGFGYWLAGFVDGEGYFALTVPKRRGTPYRGRTLIQPKACLSITQRRDNSLVLHEVQQYLGCGTVYDFAGTGRSKPISVYRVHRVAELAEVIIPYFSRYPLRTKKQQVFQVWKQGVQLLHQILLKPRRGGGRYGGAKWTPELLDRVREFSLQMEYIRSMNYSVQTT